MILCYRVKRANITGPNSSNRHQSVMDSLPQEIIDEIIDNLPRRSLHSSSLVARRWRTRSQQHIFDSIAFSSQGKVDRWYSDVQRGGNRVVSYVRSAKFRGIVSWNEPALFGLVLKGLCSLETLHVHGCAIPDKLPGQILCGEFGRGILNLSLRLPRCSGFSTAASMILSLPDLKKLSVTFNKKPPIQPLSTPIAPQRRSLDLLELYLYSNEVAEALIQARLTSRCICLGGAISSVHRLLATSSETLIALMLDGV